MRGRSIALAALCLALPAGASASEGNLHLDYTALGTNGSVMGSRFVETTNACRAGKAAVSGGGETTGGFAQEALVASLESSSDMVHFNLWQAAFDNLSAHSGQTVTAGAVCASIKGYVPKLAGTPNPGSSRDTAKARCPKRTHVVGGGGYTTGGFGAQRLVDSAPYDSKDRGHDPDDGWTATADNVLSESDNLYAYAECAPLGGLDYVSKPFKVAGGHRGKRSAKCPDGELVLGGGLTQNGALGKVLVTGTLYDASTDKAWNARFDNVGGKKIHARTFAICHS
jgi:hypothetical protein